MSQTFTIDGRVIPFAEGQTILQAASAAGIFIPHLCHHPDFKPHGSCKLCTVKVNAGMRRRARCGRWPAWPSRAIPGKSTANAAR